MAETNHIVVQPPVKATGFWVTYAPFDVPTDVILRCEAIRTVDDLSFIGIDAFYIYYYTAGVSQATYESDVAKGMTIVTLTDNDGTSYHVPTTYIASYPGMDGITYDRKLLLLELGPLPSTLDVSYLIDDIKDLIAARVGVDDETSSLEIVTIPMEGTLTNEEYVQLETTRRAIIEQHTSLLSKLTSALTTVGSLTNQVNELTNVVANYPAMSTIIDDIEDNNDIEALTKAGEEATGISNGN